MARRMLAPIHSIKHYVHRGSTTVASGVNSQFVIVDAIVKGAARSNTFDVEEGAIVKAVYIQLWLSGVANMQASWALIKRPAGAGAPTVAEMISLGTYPNKKNILHSGQGLTPSGGNQMAIFNGWYKIPKGKQRFGLEDLLSITINSVGGDVQICGLSTYKEYE